MKPCALSSPAKSNTLLSFPKPSRSTLGPPSLLLSGYRDYFHGSKPPGRDVNHWPPSGTEVKNEWSVPPFCLCASVAWTGSASRFEHSGCVCLPFLMLLLLKCNPTVLTKTSGQTLDTDVNKYERSCFQDCDTVHVCISVTEETGFSETSVFICPTTASHPVGSSWHSA